MRVINGVRFTEYKIRKKERRIKNLGSKAKIGEKFSSNHWVFTAWKSDTEIKL